MIRVETKALLDAATKANRAITSTFIPVLECFLIDRGKITGSNLSLSITANFEYVHLQSFPEIPFLVPAKKFMDILKKAGNSVTILPEVTTKKVPVNRREPNGEQTDVNIYKVLIESGSRKYTLSVSDPAEFPKIEKVNIKIGEMAPEDLQSVRTCLPFISKDVLSKYDGVFLGKTVFATDATIAAYFTAQGNMPNVIVPLLPSKYIAEFETGEIWDVLDGDRKEGEMHKWLIFKNKDVEIATRLSENKHQDILKVVPYSHVVEFTTERKVFEETLNAALVVKEYVEVIVNEEGNRTEVLVKAENTDFEDTFQEFIPAQIVADQGMSIMFNIKLAKIITKSMKDCKVDKLRFMFSHPGKVIKINDNYLLFPYVEK